MKQQDLILTFLIRKDLASWELEGVNKPILDWQIKSARLAEWQVE